MVQMLFFNLLLALSCCFFAPSLSLAQINPSAKKSASAKAKAAPESPAAKIQGLTLQADNLMRDHEREIIELDGNVQIVRGDQHISCQRAIIYLRSKKLELFGQVSVVSNQQTLNGEEILLDDERSACSVTGR